MLKINQLLIKKIYKPDIDTEPDTPVMDRSTCQSPQPCDDGVDHPGLTSLANRESHEEQPLVDLGDQKSQNDRPSCFVGLIRSVIPCLGKREPNYASDRQSEPVPEEGDKLWAARGAVTEHSALVGVPEVKKLTGIV